MDYHNEMIQCLHVSANVIFEKPSVTQLSMHKMTLKF